MVNNQTYVPVAEAVEQTGIDYRKLMRLRHQDLIDTAKNDNGQVVVNVESVEAWKDKNIPSCRKPKFLGNPALAFGDLQLDFDTHFKPILSQNKAEEIFQPDRNELRLQYWITNTGKVFSADVGVYLQPDIKNTYQYVNLKTAENKYDHFYVHYLVGYYFCKGFNRFGVRIVHHIDKNPLNNHYKNLIWVTDKEHGELHKLLDSGDKKAYRKRIREIQKENNKW